MPAGNQQNLHPHLRVKTQKDFDSLSPEQKRVIEVLLSVWPSEKDFIYCSPIPEVLHTGYSRFSLQAVHVEDLPKESHWIWRQCNAKIATQVGDATVVIQKFNTRSNKQCSSNLTRPSFKLWNLRVYQKNVAFTFLYCEKGLCPIQKQKLTSMNPYEYFPQPNTTTNYLSLSQSTFCDPQLDLWKSFSNGITTEQQFNSLEPFNQEVMELLGIM